MFGGFYCLSWGRRGRTCGRDSHIQGELFPLQSSQGTCRAGMQQKPLLDLFSPPWMEGLSEAIPSLLQAVPQAVSPGASAEPLGQLLPHCPSPTFSSAGSDCSSPKARFSHPQCPPLPWQCHLQSPPCHLASLGVGRPAPFLPPGRVYAWQLQPARGYEECEGLSAEAPNLWGAVLPRSPTNTCSKTFQPDSSCIPAWPALVPPCRASLVH